MVKVIAESKQMAVTLRWNGKLTGGTICVNQCKTYKGTPGWKACVKSPIFGRNFGVARDSANETLSLLLKRLATCLTPGEQERILRLGTGIQQRIALRRIPGVRVGSPPPTDSQVPEQGSQPTSPVRWVHQIFGLFKDDKPMSDLFMGSSAKWQKLAFDMNATYHMWNADETDTLIRDHYPFIWKVYQNVRYPVMRCDIARVAILHRYGGMYTDMDVYPNRLEYAQCDLAVLAVPARNKRKQYHLDMEVIIAGHRNPVLLQWLHYIAKRVKEVQWRKKHRSGTMRRCSTSGGPRAPWPWRNF